MSLIAWYPFNGNINDFSGNNNNLNITPIFSSDGKIGECIHLSDTIITPITPDLWNFGDGSVSFCGWFRLNEQDILTKLATLSYTDIRYVPTGNLLGFNSYGGFSLSWSCIYTQATNSWSNIAVKGYIRSSIPTNNSTSSKHVPYDEWVHYACIYNKDTNKLGLYINGNLFSEITTDNFDYSNFTHRNFMINNDYVDGGNGPGSSIPIKLNDIRLYNHALSLKELKEIYKTKILHYTFDYPVQPYTNIIKNNTYAIYNNAGSTECPSSLVKTGIYYQGCEIYRLTQTPSDTAIESYGFKTSLSSHGIYFNPMTFKALTKYSSSILWRPVSHSDIVFGGTAQNAPSYWLSGTNDKLNDGWTRYYQYMNGTINTTDKTNPVFFSYYVPSLESGKSIVIDFCCPDIVEGRTTPVNIDYNNNGYNKINDISGYNNYGTIVDLTTPDWVYDNKLGTGSYKFELPSIIKHPNPFLNQDNIYQEWTCTAWVKLDDDSNIQKLNDFNQGNYVKYGSNNSLLYLNSGINDYYTYGSNVSNSEWHHIVFVFRNSDGLRKIYCDGIDISTPGGPNKTSSPSGIPALVTIGYDFKGIMDDYRIYATALSSNDILELYQNRMQLDNTGNLYIYNTNELYNHFNPIDFYQSVNSPLSNKPTYEIVDGIETWDVYPSYFHPYSALRGRFKPNTQYIIHIRYKHYTYHNSDYVTGGFVIRYSDGTYNNIISKGNTEWQTVDLISDINKTISYISVHYYTSFRVYIDINSYIKEYTNMSINTNGNLLCNQLSEVGVTDKLIAYYPLDGNLKDYSGNNYVATNNGTIISKGSTQLAYRFDGSNKYILPNIPIEVFNSISIFTIGLWIKLDEVILSSGIVPFGIQDPTNSRIYIGKSPNINKWSFGIGNSSWNSSSTGDTTTELTYLVLSVNKNTSVANLYVNGVLSQTKTGWIWGDILSQPRLGNLNGNYNFKGFIQDFRLYEKELTQEEVSIMYDLGIGNSMMKVTSTGNIYINNEVKEV